MITIFNERELALTMSNVKLLNITQALHANDIEYLVIPTSTGTSGATFCSRIVVKKKDYDRAMSVLKKL